MPAKSAAKKPSATAAAAAQIEADPDTLVSSIVAAFRSYTANTPPRLRLIDTFLIFHLVSGIVYFLYAILIANHPLNAFFATFGSNVGQFVLLASLRTQVNSANKSEFPSTSPERAFGEFVFASLVLHTFVFSFLG